jgi:lipopolysaccharide assembly outer membrane protein LptD (OstA)
MTAIFRARIAGLLLAMIVFPDAPAGAQGIPGLERSVRDAKTQAVEISADILEYEAAREVYVASGDVLVSQGARTLNADWIAFNPQTGVGVASGNVRLVEGEDTLVADFVEFEIETLQGIVRNGRLESPDSQFKIAGASIEKTGERTYRLEDATFTTCFCEDEECAEPWSIRARQADLEVDGYGTVRDAQVEVFGVPVAWMPWMIYPLKTERETGFLFPEITLASRDGFGLGLPFFWAVNDQVNATVTPGFTVDRGFEIDGEVEYVLGEESWGDVYGAFIADQEIDPHSLRNPYGRERWGTLGKQAFFLPAGLSFKTDIRVASDNDVPIDFDGFSDLRADRYLESIASLSGGIGSSGRLGGSVSAQFADDLQNPDDIDRDDFLLQRVPDVQLAALPGDVPGVPWLRPSLDVDYTLFKSVNRTRYGTGTNGFLDTGVDGIANPLEFRRGSPPDPDRDDFDALTNPRGTEADGFFQEGEPLTDNGQRVMLAPRLAAPFQVGELFEVYPEAGWQETLYATDEDSNASRGLFTGRVDLRSRLRRRFDSGRLHLVEPFVGYAYVSSTSQSGNPLLVPGTAIPQQRIRALDLDNVTRDGADRIPRANRVSFGVAQRLYGERSGDDSGLRADLTLLGIYEFAENRWGSVVADGRVSPWDIGQVRFSAGFDPEGLKLEEALSEWTWRHDRGHSLSLAYRYLRNVPNVFEDFGTGERFKDVKDSDRINQLNGGFRLMVNRQWSVAYRAAYTFEEGLLLGNEGIVEYLSKCGCWAAGVEVSQDRAKGFEAKFLYRIIGLGRDQLQDRGGLLD